jgi:hypothetical protein
MVSLLPINTQYIRVQRFQNLVNIVEQKLEKTVFRSILCGHFAYSDSVTRLPTSFFMTQFHSGTY